VSRPLLFRLSPAALLLGGLFCASSPAQTLPPADAFQVLPQSLAGPRITAYLQYQLDEAWRQDEARQRDWQTIGSEQDLAKMQENIRQSLLKMIGGLPDEKTPLHPRITGKIQMDGYSIEKLIFESLPGVYVTALVYAPDDHSKKHPAVLVPAGHATNGKIHYQVLSQRLARRGYLAIAWDPVGQGERSQFWDEKTGQSRYNLVCAEHAVTGNLAYLAGASLARWEIWDGIRAVDYLLTRPDVDSGRINITGTSGGGTQTALIAALDPRIKVAVPSCYISAMPMRMGNRIFADPDSDPEQDLFGMLRNHVDHPGLLLLMYPRPVLVASAVLDFFPIEGARKSFREVQRIYEHFGYANRIAMTEGYHQHQYSDENQEAALDFLDRFNGMPARHGLATPKELPDSDLLCTRSGQVAVEQPDARPLMELIREYYQQRKASPARSLTAEYFEGQQTPAQWTVGEFLSAPPREGQILWEFAGSSTIGKAQIDKYVLHHNKLLAMPLVYIHAPENESKNLLLWFSEAGKATPADWPQMEKFLESGYGIVTFDFRGLGETRMAYTAISPDDPKLGQLDFDHAYTNSISGVLANYVYNSLLVGRPYFFQMIEDADIAKQFAAQKLNGKVNAVTAPGAGYTLANAIAEVFPGVKVLPQPNTKILKWSDLVNSKQEIWPIEYLLPGGAYIH